MSRMRGDIIRAQPPIRMRFRILLNPKFLPRTDARIKTRHRNLVHTINRHIGSLLRPTSAHSLDRATHPPGVPERSSLTLLPHLPLHFSRPIPVQQRSSLCGPTGNLARDDSPGGETGQKATKRPLLRPRDALEHPNSQPRGPAQLAPAQIPSNPFPKFSRQRKRISWSRVSPLSLPEPGSGSHGGTGPPLP